MPQSSVDVLVTGGAGYIGSHTVVELIEAGFNPIVLDNFANAFKGHDSPKPESILKIEKLYNREISFYNVDVRDQAQIVRVFEAHPGLSSVLHFAALKAVGESFDLPLLYYQVNVAGTMNLLQVMRDFNVFHFVFSSSATVYGQPEYLPLDEKHTVGTCTNPYGKTKYFIEQILQDLSRSDDRWRVSILRYFNPVGAHKSGEIGENPQGVPNNLMPYVSQVAVGKRPELNVYGDDYPTQDGTGVRDYIHVVDLAAGHVAALNKLATSPGLAIYNLGTGRGYSVLEMVKAFEAASGQKVPYKICSRRVGDVASVYADVSLAETELGWKAKRSLEEMCEDLWRFQSKNK